MLYAWFLASVEGTPPAGWVLTHFSTSLGVAATLALIAGWFWRSPSRSINWADLVLIVVSTLVAAYLVMVLGRWRMTAGMPMANPVDMLVAATGVVLIMELTRRVAGLALIIITGVFLAYAFAGPYLPGLLEHRGYSAARFFTYLYTDNGVLGPTTAVSSTYIILFITFAAFLQASRVGDYFVNFAFAAAGRARVGRRRSRSLPPG